MLQQSAPARFCKAKATDCGNEPPHTVSSGRKKPRHVDRALARCKTARDASAHDRRPTKHTTSGGCDAGRCSTSVACGVALAVPLNATIVTHAAAGE